MKTPLRRLCAGVIIAACAVHLSAQEETKAPVLDWLYVDVGPTVVTADLPPTPSKQVKYGDGGQATVAFVVNERGDVEQLSVPEATSPALAEIAASAVAKWKFTPAQQHGQAVSTRLQAPFIFERGKEPRLLISLASYGPYTGEIDQRPGVKSAEPRFMARPVYPAELRAQGTPGTAVLKFVITESGDVANVKLVSATNPAFAVAASNALMRWKFKPAKRDGHPVAVASQVPIEFSVNDSAN